jgi:hypothetical protein
MVVQPFCFDVVNAAPVQEIHSTALAFASMPFEAWQGTIKFHFKVVCSEYHRGRLRLVYNPLSNPVGVVPMNQVYSTIIDITSDREFDYECKWTNVRAWQNCWGIQAAGATTFSTTNPVTGGTSYDNGTLSVYVINELATPSTSPADVKIQVWVSAGDDFAVAVPGQGLVNLSYFKQQSEMSSPDSMLARGDDNSNNPVGGNLIESFGTGEDLISHNDNQYLVYQGERIVSFKDLLRRYQYANSYFPYSFPGTFRMYILDLPGMPLYRGWDPNGIDLAVDSTAANRNYNFCSMTLLNYLAPAFVCQRGSLRHKFVAAHQPAHSLMSVTRQGILVNVPYFQYAVELVGNLGLRRKNLLSALRSTLNGTALTPTAFNPVLEIEVPFYSAGQRFRFGRFLNMAGVGDRQGVQISFDLTNKSSNDENRIEQYVSVGEDFTLGLFVGAPIIYTYANPIPA